MRLIIALITPALLSAQSYSITINTTFQLQYAPIALISTNTPVLSAKASVANEAGLAISSPNLEPDFTELFVTISKHKNVDVVIRKLPNEIVDVSCTAQKVKVLSGCYSSTGTFLTTTVDKVLFNTEGICTGTQMGTGIPIVFECQSYANYSLLGAGDHSVNFLLQVL